jgi:hypothetical protein
MPKAHQFTQRPSWTPRLLTSSCNLGAACGPPDGPCTGFGAGPLVSGGVVGLIGPAAVGPWPKRPWRVLLVLQPGARGGDPVIGAARRPQPLR